MLQHGDTENTEKTHNSFWFSPCPPCLRVGIALLLVAFIAKSAQADDFTFIHVSDIHVGAGKNAETDAALLKEISALDPKPAFVAGTGDLCETGTPAQYKTYREIAGDLTLKSYQAPGNHDVRWNPLGKEGFVKGSGQPMYQSWSYGGLHFVLLDSTTLLQHWGHFDADELTWLKDDLEKWGTEKPIVIGFHHPIGSHGDSVDNEQDLLDLVAPYNVRLWLQGHGHRNVFWNVNGAPAVMVQGLYQGAYDIISIKGDTLSIDRRLIPEPKKGELLDDKPDASAEPKHVHIATVSLKKQIAPNWSARMASPDEIEIDPGDLPPNVKLAMRIDSGKFDPVDASDNWKIPFKPTRAGIHNMMLEAMLPDGRAYLLPLTATTEKSAAPKPAWETNIGAAVMSRLVRDEDTLYVPSMGGDLISMDPATGKEYWRFKTAGAVFSTPQVNDGVVYFGSADHNIYAVDASTGKLKWKHETGGAVFGGASVAKGVVCIASCDKTIYGLDAADGETKWTVHTGGMTQSKVATDGKLFFVGTWDNSFRAIDATTGKEAWQQKFGKSRGGDYNFYFAPAIGSPTVAEGNVYISSNDGLLHAVDIATGKIAWETPQSHQLGYCGPLYHDGKIFQGSLNGSVYCFDAKTGKEQWKAETGDAIYDSSAAFGNGKIYIGCVSGIFTAINANTGKIAWQYRLGQGHVLASPTTDDNDVYISSMSGKVTALPIK